MPDSVVLIPFQVETAGQLHENTAQIIARVEQQMAAMPKGENVHLVFPELCMVGADAAEGFLRINNNQIDNELKRILASSAKYPSASLYVGFPYIVDGERRICHACIKGGQILYVRGKSELANNIGGVPQASDASKTTAAGIGVEYETRWFRPVKPGVSTLTIAGQDVNFGAYGDNETNNKLKHGDSALIVCEEMFIGTEDFGNMEQNPMVRLARAGVKQFMIVNASPNANYKAERRPAVLAKIAAYLQSQGIKDVSLHYGNNYGTQSGVNYFDGAAHHVYYDTGKDAYVLRSQLYTDKALTYDPNNKNETLNEGDFFLADHAVEHENLKEKHKDTQADVVKDGQPLPYRHVLKNVFPLVFADADYTYQALKRHSAKYKGYFVSISGGFDSAFTIVNVSLALEITLRKYHKSRGSLSAAVQQICEELNITAARHGDFYHQLMAAATLESAAKLLKSNLIKAAFIKTENNSAETENAARSIAQEIGADFKVIEIDDMYMSIVLSYMFPVKFEALSDDAKKTMITAYKNLLNSNSEKYDNNMAALKNAASDLNLGEPHIIIHWKQDKPVDLENIQARTRAWVNWIAGDVNGFLPTSNPNYNESINGYTTQCGDLHAGKFSVTAHRQKPHIQLILSYIQKYGIPENPLMTGRVSPIKAVELLWIIKPSAELQKLGDDGKTQQTDEGAYGLSYHQLFVLSLHMFRASTNPNENASFINMHELLTKLREDLLFSPVSELGVLKMLRDVYGRFLFSRFKRRAMPISQVTENSIDPHANLRYPILGTYEYIQADINMAYLRIQFPEWVAQNEDRIDLLLLTNKAFASDVTNLRNKALDQNVAATQNDLDRLSVFLAKKETVSPLSPEPESADNFILAANITSTPLNYEDSVKKIKLMIDAACRQGVSLLVFPEFTLTGHDLDDAVRFVRNKQMTLLLNEIAEYAHDRNPALTVAMGHPWVPNNQTQTDRSQGFVSAMSLLSGGKIQKTIVRSEPIALAKENSPQYLARQMRTLKDYHDGIVTTDNTYVLNYQGKPFTVGFCFDTPTAETKQSLNIQVGGTFSRTPNTLYVNQRGASAASTCRDGLIGYTDQQSNTFPLTERYVFGDLNSATIGLSGEGHFVHGQAAKEDLSQRSLMLKHDALYAYEYLRSAPLVFTVSLSGEIDAFYNIAVIRKAIELRFAALNRLTLSEKCAQVCAELGVKIDEEQLRSMEDEPSAINMVLNKKLKVIDLNKDPVVVPPELGVIVEHYPVNESLFDAIISKVAAQYGKTNKDFDTTESRNRYHAIVAWMITSVSTIAIANGSRTSLGLGTMVFGGDLHQGAISFSMHRSRTEMRQILGMDLSTAEAAKDKRIDAIHTEMRKPLIGMRDSIRSLADFNEFKFIYCQWFEGGLERNALPITPETPQSLDRQTAYREIPYARPLQHELVELVLALMCDDADDELLMQYLLSKDEVYQSIQTHVLQKGDVTGEQWLRAKQDIQRHVDAFKRENPRHVISQLMDQKMCFFSPRPAPLIIDPRSTPGLRIGN